MAEEYLVDRLKAMCEVQLRKMLTPRNAPIILYHTDLLNAEALKDHCFGIIIENYGETLYGEQVKSLPKPLILELLQRFAESRNPNLKKRRSRDGDDSSGSTRGSTKRRAPYRKVRFDVAADPI
mmetsp:Transcript_12596/g.20178  ORF Transcript_12596/g.20178 Transcript_12596/m.20178 type:complete len:124 (+) Transcript_12596:209-580(+)